MHSPDLIRLERLMRKTKHSRLEDDHHYHLLQGHDDMPGISHSEYPVVRNFSHVFICSPRDPCVLLAYLGREDVRQLALTCDTGVLSKLRNQHAQRTNSRVFASRICLWSQLACMARLALCALWGPTSGRESYPQASATAKHEASRTAFGFR